MTNSGKGRLDLPSDDAILPEDEIRSDTVLSVVAKDDHAGGEGQSRDATSNGERTYPSGFMLSPV